MSTYKLLIGGYNDFIPTLRFAPESSTPLVQVATSPALSKPSWIEISPGSGGKTLLAANELDEGRVSTYRVSDDGLKVLQVDSASTEGAHTAYAATSRAGDYIYGINYTGASIASRSLDPSTGKLGTEVQVTSHTGTSVHPERQLAPHPHQFKLHPSLPIAYVPDLGTDEVHVYSSKDNGSLDLKEKVKLPPGSGPRHLQFHPNNRIAYLIGEISSTVHVLSVDPATGSFVELSSHSVLPPRGASSPASWGAASILVSQDGRFLYTSDRNLGEEVDAKAGKQDNIKVFAISDEGKTLKAIADVETGGVGAREFKLSHDDRYLAVGNQFSKSISVFAKSPESGALKLVVTKSFDFIPTSIVWLA